MDDTTLLARMHGSLWRFYELIAAASDRSRLLRLDGVIGAVVPDAPDRSVCNGVVSQRPQALGAALGELAAAYEAAGVRAWTVWLSPGDGESAGLLEAAGHVLDATPLAMGMELENFTRTRSPHADIVAVDDPAALARINDAAYRYEGDFARTIRRFPAAANLYEARTDGLPLACLMSYYEDGDCGIFFVATAPEARGGGLATELMTQALLDARERGCTTTTLQATKAGEPIYTKLGYRELGRLEMWERRRDD